MNKLEFARVRDAVEVHAMLWSCWRDIPLTDKFNNPEYVKWARDACKSKQFLVVRIGSEIAGVMHLKAHKLLYIAVREGHRKRGIARSFIAYAKKRWSTLTVESDENNVRSIKLLESEGFRRDPTALVTKPSWKAYIWKRGHGQSR